MASYALTTSYIGESLLSGFNWLDGPDPSHGYVSYQSRPNAKALGLFSVDDQTGVVRLGVDSTNTYPLTAGRPSIRLESKQAFNHGLFIADFLHMPPSQCGVWPAFWSYGPNWPTGGEIDIIEGVNDQNRNILSAHTTAGCEISKSLHGKFLGVQRETDCDVGGDNVGCGYYSPAGDTSAYGNGFNAAQGGVYAMEWDDEFIKIWHFARRNIPEDITKKTPDPTGWGKPDAMFGGQDCDVNKFFNDMKLVININFCGDWAGTAWRASDVCTKVADTCNEYVANNPRAFSNTYWDVRYIEAYQKIHAQTTSRSLSPSTTEPLTRVTSTTTITTTVTLSRKRITTTSKVANATSTFESTQSSSGKATARTSPVYKLNTTSSYNTTIERSAKLNTTSSWASSHGSRVANTTTSLLLATAPSTSQRSIPTNTTAVLRHTISSLISAPSGTFRNTSHASSHRAASTPISTPSEVPAAENPIRLGDFAYLGCYESSDDLKLFRKVKDSKDMTIDLCVDVCRDSMFSAVYDTQCFCADSMDTSTRAANTKNGDVCDHPCPGNASQYCGGLAKSPDEIANATSTAASERFANNASSTGVTASKSTATGQQLTNSTIVKARKNSAFASRLHAPHKGGFVKRMERAILLTVYGVVKDGTPPPALSMAENNITYTSTRYSTTVRVKTVSVIPIQETAGASYDNTVEGDGPSGARVADKNVVSIQGISAQSEGEPGRDKYLAKTAPTEEHATPAKDGFAADVGQAGSHADGETVDRVVETAAPSNVEFVVGHRLGGSPVAGETVVETVDQMRVVFEDCGCTEGEVRATASPLPPPPSSPAEDRTNSHRPVPSNTEVPVPAQGSEHTQPELPSGQDTATPHHVPSNMEVPVPAQYSESTQPELPSGQDTTTPHQVPSNMEVPVPAQYPESTQPELPSGQDTSTPHHVPSNMEVPVPAQYSESTQPELPSGQDTTTPHHVPSNMEVPVPARGSEHTQPAPPPAHNPEFDVPKSSGNDSPAPIGAPEEIQHAPPSPASPPGLSPLAQVTNPYGATSSGFETLAPGGTSQEAQTVRPPVVVAGARETWSRAPGIMLGSIILVLGVLL
ncbi:Glycosyl hydrolase family 16 protein [Metarhizium album ARSEF 1941]|uniref:Glycosyl hydrolase family 16 protein n=1 Tax=Metarhizium album (strain ARSEF 1941) TaxID=1081103 RepID=A0A0B2WME4_METAS|nr:Glycosyl hydrolase family 16 protein [Metarhizium album ARSEF 1941]KHN94185.1 Glycosyl hydrolase family 16 protein [Metarhizium album ARSEF 1941]